MGVHGLTQFVKSYPTLVTEKQWKYSSDSSNRNNADHFIIDGNAFVYYIAHENRRHWIHGGQYSTIAQAVTDMISHLRQANIQLTFLFDGALPADKLATRIHRNKSYIERCVSTYYNLKQINDSILINNNNLLLNGVQYHGDLFLIPPLTLEVVVQTLEELKVNVRICQGEADGEVVALAHAVNGYVVSQDSDMHVYPNIGQGYISFDLLSVSNDSVSAGVFHPRSLCHILGFLPRSELLPLFGTLLGNDYLDVDLVRFPITQWCSENHRVISANVKNNDSHGWPKKVISFINQLLLCNDYEPKETIEKIDKVLKPIISKSSMKSREEKADGFKDRIIDSIRRYDPSSPLLLNYPSTLDNATVRDHSCYYSRQIMDVVKSNTFWTSIFLEDTERESSWDTSRSLRQALYGFIMEQEKTVQEVEEYVREKQHLDIEKVKGGTLSSELTDKMGQFLRFHVSKATHLEVANSKYHPLILCTRYMIYHCSQSITNGKLTNYEVVAIIISGLKSIASSANDTPLPSAVPLKKRSIHLAAQFQTIIYSSYLLSQYLNFDMYKKPKVLSHLYNGLFFHSCLESSRNGASIENMLGDDVSIDVFDTIYKNSIMTDDLMTPHVKQVFDYNISKQGGMRQKPKRLIIEKSNSKQQPDKKKKKNSNSSNISNINRSANAFNVLSFGCNFDE